MRGYERTGDSISIFYCPMRRRANCKSELRLTVAAAYIVLDQNNPHDSDSHSEETPHRLRIAVANHIQAIVDAYMKISSKQIRRAIARSGEDLGVQDGYRFKRAVKKARSEVMKSAYPIGCG